MLELREPIEVDTPLGRGWAIFIESTMSDNWWTVVLSTGAVVTFRQNKIRVTRSYTFGRNMSDSEMAVIIK